MEYSFGWQHSIGLQTEIFTEKYTPKYGERTFDLSEFDGYAIGIIYLRNKLNYDLHLLQGKYIRFNYQFKNTWENDMFFNHAYLELKSFWQKGNSNIAARMTTGLSTNMYEPFVPFIADNYLNIRSAGNRVKRGSAEMVLNFEERYSIYRNKLGAIQAVAFTDIGVWRMVGNNFNESTNSENWMVYAGLGLRVTCFLFYNTIIRLDYGANTTDINKGRIVFGLGHYF